MFLHEYQKDKLNIIFFLKKYTFMKFSIKLTKSFSFGINVYPWFIKNVQIRAINSLKIYRESFLTH